MDGNVFVFLNLNYRPKVHMNQELAYESKSNKRWQWQYCHQRKCLSFMSFIAALTCLSYAKEKKIKKSQRSFFFTQI